MNKYYYNSKPLLNKKVLGWFEELGYKKISGNEEDTYEYFTLSNQYNKTFCIEISRKYIHFYPSKKCARNIRNRFTCDTTKTAIFACIKEVERRYGLSKEE